VAKAKSTERIEPILWQAADKLRGNLDAAEYKHVVLGLIFLKYISDAFEEKHRQLSAEQAKTGGNPEDRDEYLAENIFWVPPEEFLRDVRGLPQKNVAVELLRKLLNNEIKVRSRTFLIQSRSFSQMLEAAIRKYQNRAIEAAAVIEELIQLAKEMRDAESRGKKLGLTDEEVAFYDALGTNESAVQAMGDVNLRFIAQELLKTIRENVTIDWTVKESARAKLRVIVKRILRKHGYPPDLQEKATQIVLQQAELLCSEWAE